MIYTDEENKRWWKGLTEFDRSDILKTMVEKASSEFFRSFAKSLSMQYESGKELSPKQIATIRRWAA